MATIFHFRSRHLNLSQRMWQGCKGQCLVHLLQGLLVLCQWECLCLVSLVGLIHILQMDLQLHCLLHSCHSLHLLFLVVLEVMEVQMTPLMWTGIPQKAPVMCHHQSLQRNLVAQGTQSQFKRSLKRMR